MYVEIQDGVGKPAVRIPASQVVIYTEDGTPISVAAVYGNRQLEISHAKDPEFNRTLAKLGVRRTVICDKIPATPLPTGARVMFGP